MPLNKIANQNRIHLAWMWLFFFLQLLKFEWNETFSNICLTEEKGEQGQSIQMLHIC